jgi:mono/diheme cytochrome c family protein
LEVPSVRSSFLVAGALLIVFGVRNPNQSQSEHVSGNVEHGRYLVHEVAMCQQCHSPRDDQGNLIASKLFEGGPVAVRPPWPNDWALIAPRNKGLPGYDDAAAMRMLTDGAIGRDGKQLRAPMPRFHMSRQDASDVIAYMRSLR